jgi:hypothetical protein
MIHNPRTVGCRLSNEEWEAYSRMCKRNGVGFSDMLRAIVIDALIEEGYDALRCRESEGRSSSRETSETCGATTP